MTRQICIQSIAKIFYDPTNLYTTHCTWQICIQSIAKVFTSLLTWVSFTRGSRSLCLSITWKVFILIIHWYTIIYNGIQWYTMVYNICIQQTKNITFDYQQIPCTHSVWYHHDQFECLWTILLKQVLKGNCRSLFPGFFVCAHWFLNSMVILQFHKNAVISSF